MSTKRKRMRLPNGFGRITELKGRNLRNPWRVMVTTGIDSNGRPIGKLLKPQSYFATYNDAYSALMKYHENPETMRETMTVEELHDRWVTAHYPEVSIGTQRLYDAAWKYCEKIKGLVVSEVRSRHIKECCENGVNAAGNPIPANTRLIVKTLLNMLFKYALENDLVDRNYAADVSLSKSTHKTIAAQKIDHQSFTDSDLNIMWDMVDKTQNVDMLLIQCYMGWRPTEMLKLEVSNIDLEKRTITGGIKTEAGTNRVVPIHSLIYPLVEARYNKAMEHSNKFLFIGSRTGQQMLYAVYNRIFKEVLVTCGINESHRPHDPRKTFVTMAKKYNVDEYALKLIVGHYISDLTERVYCERDITWLQAEIEKIRRPSC